MENELVQKQNEKFKSQLKNVIKAKFKVKRNKLILFAVVFIIVLCTVGLFLIKNNQEKDNKTVISKASLEKIIHIKMLGSKAP